MYYFHRIAELNEKLKKASLGPTKVYISDLHSNIDETMIKAVLESFGQVSNWTCQFESFDLSPLARSFHYSHTLLPI